MTKFIVVSGGVISGIGKGVIASSTGLLLKTLGLRVTAIKIDPYMNIDAGTMAPTEHGEVFVLDDGGEADLDLGNYERYLDVTLSRDNNITTGKIYRQVIEKERRGDYLGKTVQIVPHLTNAIQDWLLKVATQPVDSSGLAPEVCIVELGGTVGDIESAPFVEALRQFQFRVGQENFALIHVSLVPVIGGEQKTKPTQAAIRDLRGLGLVPDMIACRSPAKLDPTVINKLSMFCHVAPDQVLGVHDVESTYHVPLLLEQQGMVKFFEKRLGLELKGMEASKKDLGRDLRRRWRELTADHARMIDSVEIVLVGKYTSLQDSYMSVVKSLEHAAMRCHRKLKLKWVEASDLEPQTASENPVRYHEAWRSLCSAKGIIVPGGFGVRGTEGMVSAAKWAREKGVPFLGICLGFQIAVVEFARNVCGMTGANSSELDPDCPNPVVIYMPEVSKTHLGGTMRLGLRPSVFTEESQSWSKIRNLYGGGDACWERHRHRYEINPEMVARLERGGIFGEDVAFTPSRTIEPSPPRLQLLPHQESYLSLLLSSQILAFNGPYTLKSGRKSPYFFNAGLFNSGAKIAEVARCYAEAIMGSGLISSEEDKRETVLFGPAYKGIPLSTAVALSLSQEPHSIDLGFSYNRKEKKDHGEGGTLVGAPMKGKRVIILDDVITAGTAINEAVDIIKAEGGHLVGVVIALDRQEKVKEDDERSAVGAVEQRLGTPVVSVVNLNQVITFLEGRGMSQEVEGMKEYRARYGVAPVTEAAPSTPSASTTEIEPVAPTSPGQAYPGATDAGFSVRSFQRSASSASAYSTLAPSETTLSSDEQLQPATSLRFVGKSTSGARMQILELQDHPYFVGMQAHPEFASRPLNPSPPFLGLVAAASGLDVLEEQLARGHEYRPPHPTGMMVLGQVQGEAAAHEDAAMAKLKPQPAATSAAAAAKTKPTPAALPPASAIRASLLEEEGPGGAATPIGARSPRRTSAASDLAASDNLPPGTGSQVVNGASEH